MKRETTRLKTILIFGLQILLLAWPAQAKSGGVALSFGSSFQQAQKKEFKTGNGAYFRIKFRRSSGACFFIHNEQSSFNVVSGDAVANGTQNVQGIGAEFPVFDDFSLELLLGGANLTLPAATSSSNGKENVTAAKTSDLIADIGFKWKYAPETTTLGDKLSLGVNLNFRTHRLSQEIILTDSEGATAVLSDKSSVNLALEIEYGF